MNKLSREFKTGVVVVVVAALFIWGFNYLKGYNLFEGPSTSYFTEYDNVQGLNSASIVTINGYEVGQVIDISFNKDPLKRGGLVVEFSVESDFEFSKNSIAKIYSASLMGGKSLAIIPSYEGDQAVPGDILKGEIESDMFSSFGEKLNPLQAKLESVIVSADSLLVHLNDVMDKETILNIKKSIASFEGTMHNLENTSKNADSLLAENRSTITATIRNAEKITENFSKISDSLSNVKFNELVDKIKVTVVNLETMTEGINQGKGTVGKLMNDETVYINLSNATKELEELLKEMKLHPKRFVHFSLFGKKDKGYVENEEE
jgi:phospholipid/cholesterol/gamma-HCH transport system substrate-binding protein